MDTTKITKITDFAWLYENDSIVEDNKTYLNCEGKPGAYLPALAEEVLEILDMSMGMYAGAKFVFNEIPCTLNIGDSIEQFHRNYNKAVNDRYEKNKYRNGLRI